MTSMNWNAILPEIVLLVMACVVALADLFVTDPQQNNVPSFGPIAVTTIGNTDTVFALDGLPVIGDETVRRNCAAGLKSATPFIRQQLGRQLQMRYTPDLLFQYDSSIDYGNRIESLLREIHHDDGDKP